MTRNDKLVLTMVNKSRDVRVSHPCDLARGSLDSFLRNNMRQAIHGLELSPLDAPYKFDMMVQRE